MNGDKITEIKGMTDGEFRVLLVEKMENMQKDQATCKKEMKDTKKCLNKLAVQVAKIPPHCIQVDTIKEHDNRIDELEKKEAASKAIKSLLIGLISGVGGGSGVLAILKLFHLLP